METRFSQPTHKRTPGETRGQAETDEHGNLFVNASVRHAAALAVNATLDVPCDYLNFSVDCTATIEHAEDTAGEAVPIAVKGGQWIRSSAVKVTAVTAGATIVAGWIRRPPA